MMYRAIYGSRSKAGELNKDELQTMVEDADAHNAQVGITGALIKIGDIFLQVLEGDRTALTKLLTKILIDKRHSEIQLIEMVPILKRDFHLWGMHIHDISDDPRLIRYFVTHKVNLERIDAYIALEIALTAAQ
jgi:hypothetical protein